jgi:peptidyl-prolyl cis-trans isomerase C
VRWLVREPLVYFLAAGAALFLITEHFGGSDRQTIVVTDAERARLADQWQAQMGRSATDAEMNALVEQWLREEIYYREALTLGLDADDVIIRRRLAQKLTFLTEDLGAGAEPGDDELRAYYESHAERYAEPARFTFSHAYFSNERRSDARSDAAAALEAATERAPPSGDPFMLQRHYVDRSQREIGELFGRDFAAAILELDPGGWQGPIRSAYGWHLVRLESRRPPRQPSLEEVSARVAADLRQARRREASEAYYRSLRERFRIVMQ